MPPTSIELKTSSKKSLLIIKIQVRTKSSKRLVPFSSPKPIKNSSFYVLTTIVMKLAPSLVINTRFRRMEMPLSQAVKFT